MVQIVREGFGKGGLIEPLDQDKIVFALQRLILLYQTFDKNGLFSLGEECFGFIQSKSVTALQILGEIEMFHHEMDIPIADRCIRDDRTEKRELVDAAFEEFHNPHRDNERSRIRLQ